MFFPYQTLCRGYRHNDATAGTGRQNLQLFLARVSRRWSPQGKVEENSHPIVGAESLHGAISVFSGRSELAKCR